jgi:hypothetical protein
VETFRCPTCIAVIPDTSVRNCPLCGHRLRSGRHLVLGEDTRIGAHTLPLDEWMLTRIETSGTLSHGVEVKPVAWHGRFTEVSSAGAFYLSEMGSVAVVDAPPEPPPVEAKPEEPTPVEAKTEEPKPVEVKVVEQKVVAEPQDQLDPEVKSIIEQLYQQARADTTGDEPADDASD